MLQHPVFILVGLEDTQFLYSRVMEWAGEVLEGHLSWWAGDLKSMGSGWCTHPSFRWVYLTTQLPQMPMAPQTSCASKLGLSNLGHALDATRFPHNIHLFLLPNWTLILFKVPMNSPKVIQPFLQLWVALWHSISQWDEEGNHFLNKKPKPS